MQKRFLIETTCFFIVLIGSILYCHSSLAQSGKFAKDTRVKSYSKTVKENGWEMPWLNDTSISKIENLSLDRLTVVSKQLKLKKDLVFNIDLFYNIDNSSALSILSGNYFIQDLEKYTINEKDFAYRVDFTPEVFDNGNRTRVRAIMRIYFYDENGDGKFETRYSNLKNLKLPEWIKREK